MQNQTATACPLSIWQRNMNLFEARRIGLARRLPTVAALALPQVHKTEGQGTHTDLTPEKVQRLVRTCGAFAIGKMLKKRGLKLYEARQLMGV